MTLTENLWEVNAGLKDMKDERIYRDKLMKLEREYLNNSKVDISYYFEKKAKQFYVDKKYQESAKQMEKAILNCKDKFKKAQMIQFSKQPNVYCLFQTKKLQEALEICSSLIDKEPMQSEWLDLRGRIYLTMNAQANACKDWEKAVSMDNAKSKLRMNRHCK